MLFITLSKIYVPHPFDFLLETPYVAVRRLLALQIILHVYGLHYCLSFRIIFWPLLVFSFDIEGCLPKSVQNSLSKLEKIAKLY